MITDKVHFFTIENSLKRHRRTFFTSRSLLVVIIEFLVVFNFVAIFMSIRYDICIYRILFSIRHCEPPKVFLQDKPDFPGIFFTSRAGLIIRFLPAAQRQGLTLLWIILVLVLVLVVQTFAFFNIGTSFIGIL